MYLTSREPKQGTEAKKASGYNQYTDNDLVKLLTGPSWTTVQEWRQYNTKKIPGPLGELLWRRDRFTGTLEEMYHTENGFDWEKYSDDNILADRFPHSKHESRRGSMSTLMGRFSTMFSKRHHHADPRRTNSYRVLRSDPVFGKERVLRPVTNSSNDIPTGSSIYSIHSSTDPVLKDVTEKVNGASCVQLPMVATKENDNARQTLYSSEEVASLTRSPGFYPGYYPGLTIYDLYDRDSEVEVTTRPLLNIASTAPRLLVNTQQLMDVPEDFQEWFEKQINAICQQVGPHYC